MSINKYNVAQSIISRLESNNTTLSVFPFPETKDKITMVESLAIDRCIDINEAYNRYKKPNQSDISALVNSLTNITTKEYNHRSELEKLAVNLVLKEMAIPKDAFNFDVKIQDIGTIDPPSIINNTEKVEYTDEMIKRMMINAIIQGSAKRGHYMFHMAEEEINNIVGGNIIDDYGTMMSINDKMYWDLSDETIKSGVTKGTAAGLCYVDRNTTPVTIYVRGINFPTIVHEIIKGIMEVFSLHGLPDNYEDFTEQVDTLENETWGICLGPTIWKKLRALFPYDYIVDDVEKQNYLLVEIFKLPAEEFITFIRDVLSDNKRAETKIESLMDNI